MDLSTRTAFLKLNGGLIERETIVGRDGARALEKTANHLIENRRIPFLEVWDGHRGVPRDGRTTADPLEGR